MNSTIVFVSWTAYARRSEGLADALGAECFFVEIWKGCAWPLLPARYLLQAAATWRILRQKRPDVILTMNPPAFLPLLAYVYTRLHGARFAIDSHTGALAGHRWARLLFLHRFLSRRAATTIVTNAQLADRVRSWGAHATILQDRLPQWLPPRRPRKAGPFRVCFVCSFSNDEPIAEVLSAADSLPEYRFFVTGNPRGSDAGLIGTAPANVTFTGYLSEEAYRELVEDADVMLVLVTADHTLLCGAYEAVALEKPLVTSQWPALTSYFARGAVYVGNTPEGIQRGIALAVRDRERLADEARALKRELGPAWERRVRELKAVLARDPRAAALDPAPAMKRQRSVT